MNTGLAVPSSLRQAAAVLRMAFAARLEQLPKPQFVVAWSAVAYLFPSLHPTVTVRATAAGRAY